MFTYPGKKLLFQGCEFGQGREWAFDAALDWDLLERPQHRGVQQIVTDLNRLYRESTALHDVDFEGSGFEWIDCHDSSQSVLSYIRKDRSGERLVAAVFNFTPVPRTNYRIGVPKAGFWREAINSDAEYYGGSNVGNQGGVPSEPVPWMGRPHSIPIAVPPLGALVLVHEPARAESTADKGTAGRSSSATATTAMAATGAEAEAEAQPQSAPSAPDQARSEPTEGGD
jgi:1,4-alpha-glucan branching enzyme